MMRKVFVMVVPLLVDERVKNLSNIRCWGRGFIVRAFSSDQVSRFTLSLQPKTTNSTRGNSRAA